MNFFFKKPRGYSPPPPRQGSSRLKSSWAKDPKSGRLVQSWREEDDGERSCTGRPSGPPQHWREGWKRAA